MLAHAPLSMWRWCLDHHCVKGARPLPEFCVLCWNGTSADQSWRSVGFVEPGWVA